jgi:hypothetical protein
MIRGVLGEEAVFDPMSRNTELNIRKRKKLIMKN